MVYDEAGKIPRDFYSLTTPFCALDSNFITGGNIDHEIYPKQMPNQILLLSSAEGVDSYLWDYYKLCANKMLLADPNYFCCDLDCTHSLHPTMDGKPMAPLIQQEIVDTAFETNPYKAAREYQNRFDSDGGEDVLVKRSVINKYSQTFYPEFKNDGSKKYILAYDPSSKVDNSVVAIGELFRDEEKGLMLRIINCVSFIEILKNGEKMVMQQPEQIKRIKDLIVDYNKGYDSYNGMDLLIIDAGSGGSGANIAQYLMTDWKGKNGKIYTGLIDKEDPYQKLRESDFPQNIEQLRMFNFKANKTSGYERAQLAINQGLVIFPTSTNAKGELEIECTDSEGNMYMKYEKPTLDELNALIQIDLCKEELIGMSKQKRPNGTVVFDLSPEAKQRNMHDDHADAIMMLCDRLMELRASEALDIDKPNEDFSKLFVNRKPVHKSTNPFKTGFNPFGNRGANPFK